jgi:uncharacterized protein (DUF427 family)
MWQFTGQSRPLFAAVPGDGQESVWDYPRPPRVVTCTRTVVVRSADIDLARTGLCFRVLETASPPTYYLPPDAVTWAHLAPTDDASYCEWKGMASYWALAGDPARRPVAWTYRHPEPAFTAIGGHVAFYPGRVDCFVDTQKVRAQPGGFYGGWVTDDVVGPFKGTPGTGRW